MSIYSESQIQNDEPCAHAAVEFLNRNGGMESAASDLETVPADSRSAKKKHNSRSKPARSLSSMARLRAENEALRNQVLNLQIQWDMLKTTLGVLSTTVCTRDLI
jgi:hypothetical protein